MLPKHTAVRITADGHGLKGELGFVYRVAGEEATSGGTIGPRRAELVFETDDSEGKHTEVFHVSEYEVCGC